MEVLSGNAATPVANPSETTPPQQPQPESWFAGWRKDLRAIRSELAVFGTVMLAGIGGAIVTNEAPEHPTDPAPPAKVGKPHYRPITGIIPVHGDSKEVTYRGDAKFDELGHEIDVEQPDAAAEHAFRSFYDTPTVQVKHPPKLREVVHVQDKNIFADVYDHYPHTYGFTLYNTTSKPVDLLFVEYALRATQFWLNHNDGTEYPDLNIGGHTFADIKPIPHPHAMIMVDKIPAGAKNGVYSQTKGLTTTEPSSVTGSFIKEGDSTREPFLREAIATETCQSLVNVADEHVVPGMTIQQRLVQKHVATFNKPALHDLDLSMQEKVCNGLGNYVTAAYQRESHLRQYNLRDYLFPPTRFAPGVPIETTWLDYGLYRPDRAKFLWLAKHITQREWNEVVAPAPSESGTPTTDFYRHHQSGY